MSTAYTLIPRPENLSATATLIHRLRHPLRIQRTRYPSLLLSHTLSSRTDKDKRHPRLEDEWIESPTRSDSPCQLEEIEDKGEFSEQRYGNVNLYWNSVMVEASEEEQERRRLSEEERKRQRRRRGRVFDDSEQLQRAARNYGKGRCVNVSGQRIQSSKTHADSRVLPEPKDPLLDHSSTKPVAERLVDNLSNRPVRLHRNTNGDTEGDRYITLTENTSVAELPYVDSDHDASPLLTWNSTLDRILASPHVDGEVEATIRARERGRPIERGNRTRNPSIDMRMVGMVPNFSYPIAGAQWCERSDVDPRSVTNGYAHQDSHPSSHQSTQEHCPTATNSNNSSTPTTVLRRFPSTSSDSLYRAPTPPATAERDPYSVLRDILDPGELDMYREIVTHDPRFTVLLDDADVLSRQVSLVRKLHTVIESLEDRLADLEDCVVPELHEVLERKSDRIGDLRAERLQCEKIIQGLERSAMFGKRVLEGCWEREWSLLNTLFDIQKKRNTRRGFATIFSRGAGGYATTLRSPLASGISSGGSAISSVGFEIGKAIDSLLKRRELGALIHIAAQNVEILREGLDDTVN